ncbi:MAG: hypothetical protein WCP91_02330 [Candidatus Berkelbacteria bacterium]
MPDKYVCDCGFSSYNFVEYCPECGELIMAIDSEVDDPDVMHGPEKYEEKSDDDGDQEEMPAMAQRKAA